MTIPDIHKAFDELLTPNELPLQRRRRKIGMSGRMAAWYRWQCKQGHLQIETKLRWLQKAGIDTGSSKQYSRTDMLDFLRFSKRKDSQRSAENLGDEYLFDKWLIWVKQGRPAVVRTNCPPTPPQRAD